MRKDKGKEGRRRSKVPLKCGGCGSPLKRTAFFCEKCNRFRDPKEYGWYLDFTIPNRVVLYDQEIGREVDTLGRLTSDRTKKAIVDQTGIPQEIVNHQIATAAKQPRDSNQVPLRVVRSSCVEKDGRLYEAILYKRETCFLTWQDDKFHTVPEVELPQDHKIVRPPFAEELPYKHRTINTLYETSIAPNLLYEKIREVYRRRVYAQDYVIDLFAGATVLSYHTEAFPAIFYIYLVGDNESGKTHALRTMQLVMYRPMLCIDTSGPNVFEFLGRERGPVRGVILEDEGEDLESDEKKRRIWKGGYKKGLTVPRIVGDTRKQSYYDAYCLKIAGVEEVVTGAKAKGLLERFFIIHMMTGEPEVDELSEKDYKETQLIREALLKQRLKWYKSEWSTESFTVPIEIRGKIQRLKLKGRKKELAKPLLLLGEKYKIQQTMKETVSAVLCDYIRVRGESLEAYLAEAVVEITLGRRGERAKTWRVFNSHAWLALCKVLDGVFIERESKGGAKYTVIESDTLLFAVTKNRVANSLKSRFAGVPGRADLKGTRQRFWEIDELAIIAMAKKYNVKLPKGARTVLTDGPVKGPFKVVRDSSIGWDPGQSGHSDTL